MRKLYRNFDYIFSPLRARCSIGAIKVNWVFRQERQFPPAVLCATGGTVRIGGYTVNPAEMGTAGEPRAALVSAKTRENFSIIAATVIKPNKREITACTREPPARGPIIRKVGRVRGCFNGL